MSKLKPQPLCITHTCKKEKDGKKRHQFSWQQFRISLFHAAISSNKQPVDTNGKTIGHKTKFPNFSCPCWQRRSSGTRWMKSWNTISSSWKKRNSGKIGVGDVSVMQGLRTERFIDTNNDIHTRRKCLGYSKELLLTSPVSKYWTIIN